MEKSNDSSQINIFIDKETYDAKPLKFKAEVVPMTIKAIFGATFGAGAMALPGKAFEVGIYGYSICLVLALITQYFISSAIIFISSTKNTSSYDSIYGVLGGKLFKNIMTACYLLVNIGTLIFAADNISKIIVAISRYVGFTSHFLVNESLVPLMIAVLLLFTLMIKRNLDSLGFLVYFSIATAVLVLFTLQRTLDRFDSWFPDNVLEDRPTNQLTINKIGGIYLYCLFSMLGQPALMDIYQKMPGRSVSNMKVILKMFLTLLGILYFLIGVIGYNALGKVDGLASSMFILLYKDNCRHPSVITCSLLIILSCATCFVFVFKAVKSTVAGIIFNDSFFTEKSDYNKNNILLTVFFCTLMVGISGTFIIINFDGMKVIGLVSSFVAPAPFMIVPLLAQLKIQKRASILLVVLLIVIMYLLNTFFFVQEVINN